MAEDKKSFILYADIIGIVEKLPDEKAGQLFKIILNYVNDKDPIIEDLLLQIAFEPIKLTLKRDLKKWIDYKEKQSENGKKGGRPKKPTEETETQKTQPFFEKPKKADSVSVSVSVSDNVNDNVNDNVKEKEKKREEKREKVDTFSFKNELLSICQNEKLVNDFLLVRKSKKMVNSETAFNILKKEIEKTGGGADVCLEMAIQFNWGGFKADWYQNKINQSNQQNYGTTTLQQRPNSANQTTGSNTNRLTPEQKRANLQHYADLAARVLQESLPKNVH